MTTQAELKTESAQFTPGPWIADPMVSKARHAFYVVATPDGNNSACDIATVGPTLNPRAEANARLIAAAPELYATVERAVAFLRAAPMESGVCCCGNPIEGHGFGDGHSPVDELQYHAGGLADQFAQVLAKARGQ